MKRLTAILAALAIGCTLGAVGAHAFHDDAHQRAVSEAETMANADLLADLAMSMCDGSADLECHQKAENTLVVAACNAGSVADTLSASHYAGQPIPPVECAGGEIREWGYE
ncbi:TPA: hypothetical protein RQN04_002033 [Aeromonas hydrophila]|nr:hypothetical protein [Aeromonas hydrophila]